MQYAEAIHALATCKPLAAKLSRYGLSYMLSEGDLDTLEKYGQVYKSDLFNENTLWPAAGLSQTDMLLIRAAYWHMTDRDYSPITRLIMILVSSKALANRLTADPDYILKASDQLTLENFRQIFENEWARDEQLLHASGLDHRELEELKKLLYASHAAA